MQVHQDIDHLPQFRNAVITIGTFDGVHHGHRLILKQLREEARRVDGESVVITFDPHPRHVVGSHTTALKLINSQDEKAMLLEKQGIDHLVIVPFTPAFARQPALEYVEQFLVHNFKPAAIIIGYDHRFGHHREGNYQLLEALQEKYQYKLVEIPAGVLHDVTISSTQIRHALVQGNVEMANHFLGYAYYFTGTVIEGNRLGRTIGYPTANLKAVDSDKLLPGHGVYAVTVDFPGKLEMGAFQGMMNIGVRPTVDGTRATVEVNIFDFDREIYGWDMRVSMHFRLRGEQKFNGLDGLKNQLAVDKKMAIEMLTR